MKSLSQDQQTGLAATDAGKEGRKVYMIEVKDRTSRAADWAVTNAPNHRRRSIDMTVDQTTKWRATKILKPISRRKKITWRFLGSDSIFMGDAYTRRKKATGDQLDKVKYQLMACSSILHNIDVWRM